MAYFVGEKNTYYVLGSYICSLRTACLVGDMEGVSLYFFHSVICFHRVLPFYLFTILAACLLA